MKAVKSTAAADYSFVYSQATMVIELKRPKTYEQVPKEDPQEQTGFGEVAAWGNDNLYPQFVYKNAKANTIIPSTIERKVELLIAGGYSYGVPYFDENGVKKHRYKKNATLESFLRNINMDNYLLEAGSDLYWFYNFFPEISLNNNRKIANVYTQEATFARWKKQNEHGVVEACYINANWEYRASEKGKFTLTRPALNRYYNTAEDLQSRKTGNFFIYPVSYPSPGANYYQLASWHSAISSGWLAISQAIPEAKKIAMENGMRLKKICYVDAEYWETRFPDFMEKPELQENRKREVREEIELHLAGNKNVNKTLFLGKIFDQASRQERMLITFKELDDKSDTGEYIAESQEAASHLLYAIGLPYTLMGNSVGKNSPGAGSGSDVLEHLRMYLYRCSVHERLLLEPFNRCVLPYMGFEEEIYLLRPLIEMRANIAPEKRDSSAPQA